MLDIKFIRENPEIVKENIRKKFQEAKLPLVDEVIALDAQRRAAISEVERLKARPQPPLQGQRPPLRQAEKVRRRGGEGRHPGGDRQE